MKLWTNGPPNSSQLGPSYKIETCIGGWPNGTPNSSQLGPSYKIETCIGGWPNGPAKSSQIATRTRKLENHSIVWLRRRSHLTITKQLGESWLELARGGQTAENLARIGRLFERDQIETRSISSQLARARWGPQTMLNSIQFENLSQVGWGWEYRLVRALSNVLMKTSCLLTANCALPAALSKYSGRRGG